MSKLLTRPRKSDARRNLARPGDLAEAWAKVRGEDAVVALADGRQVFRAQGTYTVRAPWMEKAELVALLQADLARAGAEYVPGMEDRVLEFVGSDETPDRWNTIIRVDGWVLDNFRANPVFAWAHDYDDLALGRCVRVRSELEPVAGGEPRKVLAFLVLFADAAANPKADHVFRLYRGGFLSCVSIGFTILESHDIDDHDLAEEMGFHCDTYMWPKEITRQELLELSAVLVPGNPKALKRAIASGEFDAETLEHLGLRALLDAVELKARGRAARQKSPAPVTLVRESVEAIDTAGASLTTDRAAGGYVAGADVVGSPGADGPEVVTPHVPVGISGLGNHPESVQDPAVTPRGPVAFAATPKAPEGQAWDADGAKARVARWASADGSGDKDEMHWAKYRRAFAWYDETKAENLGAYKLPHHDVLDGELKVVRAGMVAAMAALHGAHGGTLIPTADMGAVHDHLAGHYKQFGMEPPAMPEGAKAAPASSDTAGQADVAVPAAPAAEAGSVAGAPTAQVRGAKLAKQLNARIDDHAWSRGQIVRDLAAAAGVSERTVYYVLDGTTVCPQEPDLRAFARVLEIPAEDLLASARADGCEYPRAAPAGTRRAALATLFGRDVDALDPTALRAAAAALGIPLFDLVAAARLDGVELAVAGTAATPPEPRSAAPAGAEFNELERALQRTRELVRGAPTPEDEPENPAEGGGRT